MKRPREDSEQTSLQSFVIVQGNFVEVFSLTTGNSTRLLFKKKLKIIICAISLHGTAVAELTRKATLSVMEVQFGQLSVFILISNHD